MEIFGVDKLQFALSRKQALYALPLAVATSSSPVRARPVLRAVGWAGQTSSCGFWVPGLRCRLEDLKGPQEEMIFQA